MTTETTQPATKRVSASTQLTVFLAHNAEVRSSAPPLSSLYIDPAGMGGGHSTTFMFGRESSFDEQIAVADRILAGVQRWRDGIVEAAERQRNAEDELAAAREEIARLKAERDGGDDA